MEKLYEITTKYTLDEHIKFNFALLKKAKFFWLMMILMCVVIVCGIISSEWYAISFAIIFPIAFLVSVYFTAKNNYNSNKAAKDAEITVEFYNDSIVQKLDAGTYKVEHDKISKIIETKTHFYIMISRIQGLIIPKKDITPEIEEHIRNIKIK